MNFYRSAALPLVLVLQMVTGPGPGTPFKHTPHRAVACLTCHNSDDGHGVLKIRTAADCSGCHHTQAKARQCTNCHQAKGLTKTYSRTFTTSTTVAKTPKARTLAFDHTRHKDVQCTSCHTNAKQMKSVPSCSSCHDDHHTEKRTCTTCHTDVKAITAHKRQVHVSCTGSGCHQSTVNTTLGTQRNVCLACHSDKTKHEPAGDCASCHMIARKTTATKAAP